MATSIVAAFKSLSGSSLTTIAGFLALCFMRLTLGMDLGIVMAKGVVLGVATVVLVLPALLLIFDEKIEKHKHRTLIPNFEKMNRFIIRHRRVFVAVFLLLFLPAVYAQSHTAVYYKLDEALPQDMDSIVANNKLKNDYDMAASHFVLLRDDLSSTEMNQLETSVKDVEGIGYAVSTAAAQILLIQIDAVSQRAHAHVQLHRLLEQQRRHAIFKLIQSSVQVGLNGGREKQSGIVGTEIVQIKVHRPLNEGGDAPAPILRISPFQSGFFLRRQVEGKFLFFAHNGSFPGFDPCFSLVGVSIGE